MQDYLAGIAGAELGHRLRSGHVRPDEFGQVFEEMFGRSGGGFWALDGQIVGQVRNALAGNAVDYFEQWYSWMMRPK